MNWRAKWEQGLPWLRLIGVFLLGVLLWRLDFKELKRVLQRTDWFLLVMAILLNLPMVFLKSLRWQKLMRTQEIRYPIVKAYAAYWSSIFVGFLTPGRLGELVKTFHVSRDCGVSIGLGLASALVDRLFDLYALLTVGGIALFSLNAGQSVSTGLLLIPLMLLLISPLALLLHDTLFEHLRVWGHRVHWLRQFVASESWLSELRSGLQQLSPLCLTTAIGMTILAHMVFFGQCYLLAMALRLSTGFLPISYAVALGSLVTLLPISISGLGTREAAIVAYLGTVGVPEEMALSFSILVFATFYIAGGLMGAIAWGLKPIPLNVLRKKQESQIKSNGSTTSN